jgi:hypothetical protein
MPKSFWWIALCTRGDDSSRLSSSCAFDVLKSAQAHVATTKGCVLLGGSTLEHAASKCCGRLPIGSQIKVKPELARNASSSFGLTVTVPSRGPVTIQEKREIRAAKKLAKSSGISKTSTSDGGDEGGNEIDFLERKVDEEDISILPIAIEVPFEVEAEVEAEEIVIPRKIRKTKRLREEQEEAIVEQPLKEKAETLEDIDTEKAARKAARIEARNAAALG